MIDKIRDNLFLGARKDLEEKPLKDLGITCIFNVANDVDDKVKGFRSEKMGFGDNKYEASIFGQQSADRLKELLKEGEIVFVHCKAGKSRSPHVIALALSEIEDKDYYEIFDELREKRPQILPISLQEEIDHGRNF